MKKLILILIPFIDLIISPIVLLSAILMRLIRRVGVYRLKISRVILNRVGVFPILDHYYEPMFNPIHLKYPLNNARKLPGIDWNSQNQLELLSQFNFNEELIELDSQDNPQRFIYDNPNFRAGDAEFLYNLIRLYKPKRLIEIGSGSSTLMAHAATKKLAQLDTNYACEHICIEPFEMPWLEKVENIQIVRKMLEDVPSDLFNTLESGDILFIDSSHVIRPQGEVLKEYLEILPTLNPGVLVHIHDIFSPRDYPEVWVIDQVRLWNEQYLLEAFLSLNNQFEIIGALNYLKHAYPDDLAAKCPVFSSDPSKYEPGSFWIRRK
jgi:predicted O-methyltransferase YrrM